MMKSKVFLVSAGIFTMIVTMFGIGYFAHFIGWREWYSMPTFFVLVVLLFGGAYLLSHGAVYGK